MNQYDDNDHILSREVREPSSSVGYSIKAHTPQHILPSCGDAEELRSLLEHYAHPTLTEVIPGGMDVQGQANRRYYLEWIRPALRYYCNKYGVDIPKWLKNDQFYHLMSRTEKIRMFGTDQLAASREFKKMTLPPEGDQNAQQ